MSKLKAVKQIVNNKWRNQPRDKQGRFASKNSLESSIKTITKKQKNSISNTIKDLVEKKYQGILKDSGFLKGDYPIVPGQKTYPELIKEYGEKEANSIIKKTLKKVVKDKAIKEKLKKDIIEERDHITKKGTSLEKYELAAWQRLYPEKQLESTLENFKKTNPKDYQKMLTEYSKELSLDKNLEYSNVMLKGKELAKKINSAKTEEEQIKAIQELHDNLKDKKNRQQAIKIVDSKIFDSSIDLIPNNRPLTAQTAVEFFELTEGRGEKITKRFELSDSRAFADKNGTLNIGSYTNKEIIFHELGHHLEYSDKRIREASNEFLKKRSKSDKPEKLKDLIPNSSYTDDEIAYRGKYINPYVGKIYNDKATEVISIGLQYFTTPTLMQELYKKDRSHFEFILGILRPLD